jgi:hypothetical protein
MKIETGIEFNPKASTRGRKPKYPFGEMAVGDSLFFDGEKIGPQCKPYAAANAYAYKNGVKFAGRTVDGGVRIWRVE